MGKRSAEADIQGTVGSLYTWGTVVAVSNDRSLAKVTIKLGA